MRGRFPSAATTANHASAYITLGSQRAWAGSELCRPALEVALVGLGFLQSPPRLPLMLRERF